MAFTAEGKIEIDLAEFWRWVHDEHLPVPKGSEILYGVPRVNKSNMTLDIDFAAATDFNPDDWAKTPSVIAQWSEPKCVSTDVEQTEPSNLTIKLVVSQTFYDAVKLLAEAEGIARADLIRKAVSHYAREMVNQNCVTELK